LVQFWKFVRAWIFNIEDVRPNKENNGFGIIWKKNRYKSYNIQECLDYAGFSVGKMNYWLNCWEDRP
jgi:hypothetical protein